ncbi:MAG TPA: DUF2510 domain-containing protein [Acidimicrobiales bacterium]|nr:DUF2510 domain-containing protein [Acidimicrobiales bacterium]
MTTNGTQLGTTEHHAADDIWFVAPHSDTQFAEPEDDGDGWAPPGWYPDPPRLRYWTGHDWSNETRPAGPPAVVVGLHGRHAKVPSPPAHEQVTPVLTIGIAPEEFAPAEQPAQPMAQPMAQPPVQPIEPLAARLLVEEEAQARAWAEEPTAQVPVVEPEVRPEGGLLHQLLMLLLVAAVAIGAGVLVAAIGIALTV